MKPAYVKDEQGIYKVISTGKVVCKVTDTNGAEHVRFLKYVESATKKEYEAFLNNKA